MKFKDGDRVTFEHWDHGGRMFGIVIGFEFHFNALKIKVDTFEYAQSFNGYHVVNPERCIHEDVYNSPLYQALL